MANISNVIKFQAPFERLKLYNASPDIILSKAIIMQAIIDATNISDLKEAKKLEIEAKMWIFENSQNFQDTCIEAGIEASFVVKITKEIIKIHKNQSTLKQHKQKNNLNKEDQETSLTNRVRMMCY